jgi:hypothetical protein
LATCPKPSSRISIGAHFSSAKTQSSFERTASILFQIQSKMSVMTINFSFSTAYYHVIERFVHPIPIARGSDYGWFGARRSLLNSQDIGCLIWRRGTRAVAEESEKYRKR